MSGPKTHDFSGTFSASDSSYIGNEFKAEIINFNHHGSSDNRRAEIARALVYPDIESRKRGIAPPALRTFDWIWNTNFVDWLKENKDVFWITGKPGSGKSTLVKYLVEHHRVRDLLRSDGHDWYILHFFFDYNFGDDTANNAEGLLRSLLIQLVRENPLIADLLQQTVTGNALSVTEQQLLDSLTNIIRRRSERFCIFVDGLDEYRGQLTKLVTMLLRLQQQVNVAMCIASRDVAAVRAKLGEYQSVVMHEHNLNSIQTFLTTVNDDLLAELRTPCPENVLLALAEQADGVILWARFALEHVLERLDDDDYSEAELLTSIKDLSPEMETMYSQTLTRIPAKLTAEAAFYLNHISTAQVNLTTVEIYALAKSLTLRHPDKFHVPPRLSSKQFLQRLHALLGGLIIVRGRDAIEYIADSMATNRCIQASRQGSLGSVAFHTIHPVHETLHAYLASSEWLHSHLDWLMAEQNLDLARVQLYVSAMEDAFRKPSTDFSTFSRILPTWFTDKSGERLTAEEQDIVQENSFAIIASIRMLNELDHHENMVSQAGPETFKARLVKIGDALPVQTYDMGRKFPILPVVLRALASPLMLFGLPFLHIDIEWHLRQYLSCGALTWTLLLPSPETLIIAFQNGTQFTEELKQAMLASVIRKAITQRYRSTAYDNARIGFILVAQLLNALPRDEHWMALYETENEIEHFLKNLREALDHYGWNKLYSSLESEHRCGLLDCMGNSFLYHIATDSVVGTKTLPELPEKSYIQTLRKCQRIEAIMLLYNSPVNMQRLCYPEGSFLHATFNVQRYSYCFSGEILLKTLFALKCGVKIRACSGAEPLHYIAWKLAWATRKFLQATSASRMFQKGDRFAYYQEIDALLKLFDYNDKYYYPAKFKHVEVSATCLVECEAVAYELLRQRRPRDWALMRKINTDDIPSASLPPVIDFQTPVNKLLNSWTLRAEDTQEAVEAYSASYFEDLTVPAKVATTPLSPTIESAFKGFTMVDETALAIQFGMLPPSEDQDEDETDKVIRKTGIARQGMLDYDFWGEDDKLQVTMKDGDLNVNEASLDVDESKTAPNQAKEES